MRRFLLLSVLFVAATLLACDEDPIAPPTTGGLTLKFVRSDDATSPLALQQTTAAEPTGQAATETGAPPANKAPIQGAGAADLLPRIVAFVPNPRPTDGSTAANSAAATSEPQQTPTSDVGARAPEAASAIDAARIRIVGPTPRVLENQAPGSTVTVEGLDPGSYTVIFEGLVGGEVDYFGTASVTVAVGENRTATLNYGSFRPTMNPFVSPTTNMTFLVSYAQAFDAERYLVEIDIEPNFSAPIFDTVITETSISIWVATAGTYYARATANNATAGYGRPGDAEAITVQLDQDASGDTRVGAALLGFSPDLTLSELNIAPPGDADWFAVDACWGDVLTVEATAQRLDPQSELDTYIDLFNATQPDSIAFNDDTFGLDSYLEATLPSGGRYFVRVRGPWVDGPTGHYDLTISVTRGPVNNGTSCDLPTGVTNGWTGSSDGFSWSAPGNWLNGVPTATDTVAIPATASPLLTENVTVASLIIEAGGHVDTDVYSLTVTGDLAAGNSITGDGTVILTGSGVSLSGGVPNLYILGDVSLSGRAFATGDALVEGALRMNGYQMAVGGVFSTINNTGMLEMMSDTDTLVVAGLANFAGGSTTGTLTAGRLILAGGIQAQAVADAFAPSGSHRVVLAGAADRTITDVIGVSFFNDLAVQTTGTVTIAGAALQAQVNGQLRSEAAVTPTVTGGNLLVQGVAVQNMVLDAATLLIGNGAITALDGVVFQNFASGTQQLIINRPGGTYTFNNLQFSQVNGASDVYIEAMDANTGDSDQLTVNLASAPPADGTPGITSVFDAVVNWVAAQAGPPTQVSFTLQPTAAAAGSTIPAFDVSVQDAQTITVDTSTASITVAINSNPGGGTLSGTTTVAAVNGVATFNDLSIDKAGGGFTLIAFSPGLTAEASAPFTISGGAPTTLLLESGTNQTGPPDSALPDSLKVKVVDAFGNGVAGVDVTWAITLGGGTLSSSVSATNALGIATTAFTLGSALGTYNVTATVSGLTGSPATFTATASTAVMWLNATDGNWSDGTNWSTGSPPTGSDAAMISVDGTYTVTIDADVNVESITLGGGGTGPTVSANARTITATGSVRLNEGSVLNLAFSTLTATAVINEGSLEPSESAIHADIDNRSQVVARRSTTLDGAITSAATILIDGAGADVTFTSGFTNTGIIEFASDTAGGYPSMYVNTGTLVNAVGGMIRFSGPGGGYLEADLENRDSLVVSSAEAVTLTGTTLINSGSGVMHAATAELDVDGAFNNSGTVNIADGQTFGSYGAGFENTLSGQVVMAPNAALDFTNTTTTFLAGYTVRAGRSVSVDGTGATGPSVTFAGNLSVASGGTIDVVNNTLTLDSLINDGDFTLNLANLVGAVYNSGTLNATGGINSVTGSVYSATDAWVEVSDAGAELVVAGDLTSHGTLKLYSTAAGTAPKLQVTGGTLANYQWFDSEGPAGGLVVVDSLFNNHEIHAISGGLLTVEGPAIFSPGWIVASDADILVRPTMFTMTGDLHLNNDHTLTVDGGTFDFSAAMFGNGTLDVSASTFTTSGFFHPGDVDAATIGTLSIVGDMVMTGGALNFHLSGTTPGTEHDVINVSGGLTLAGELLVAQAFTPTRADTFTVLNFGTKSGAFDTFTGLVIDDSLSLVPRYGLNDMKLVVMAGPDSVVVTPAGASLTTLGETRQFSATEYVGGEPQVGATFAWASLNTNVATVDSDGLVTAVASGQTTIRAQKDGVNGYALVTVTITDPAQVSVWSSIPVNGRTWGVSASDIWACSGTDEMSRFDGTSWTPISIPGGLPSCRGIWGTSMDDVFVVGTSGFVTHFNGTAWEDQSGATASNLRGVWGSSPDNVFAVGGDGTIIHYDGTGWVAQVSGSTESLGGVWGSSAQDVYVTASSGTLLHSVDGVNWAPVSGVPTTTEGLRGIWGVSDSELFVVGTAGTVWHYFNSAWAAQSSPIGDYLTGIAGSSNSDLYVVAQTGRIMRYNGSIWEETIPGVTPDTLWSAWAAPGGDLYANGTGGFRGYRGATVTTAAAITTLNAIGDTLLVTANAYDAGGSGIPGGVLFVWSSDNEAVATVDQRGVVTAESNGIANIWATATGGAADVQPITVQ